MILVLSSPDDPMGWGVVEELQSREVNFAFVSVHELPRTMRCQLCTGGLAESIIHNQGELELEEVDTIYHRIGFSNFEVFEDYADAEIEFVNLECQMALGSWLNTHPGLVVNRPKASASNASKPFQARRIRRYGFKTPRTLVTNLPSSAQSFCEELEGRVIYKSVSYHRSIVQRMSEEDYERLQLLENCPVQLQEAVEGFDVRVHVVGDRALFATRIDTEGSDYRYAKDSGFEPFDLGEEWEERCFEVTRGLNLTLSGIDLRITPEGDVYCFEVNPDPAFGWYEARTGQPITAALVDLLLDSDAFEDPGQ